jgi:hypothetical protein
MQIDEATPAGPESEYLWYREGSLPSSRADRIAEAVALVALLFSLGIGVVIAMLPVSAQAAVAAEASLEPSGARYVAARDAD